MERKRKKRGRGEKGVFFYLCCFFLLLVLFVGGDFGWFWFWFWFWFWCLLATKHKVGVRRQPGAACRRGFFCPCLSTLYIWKFLFFLIPFLIWFCICVYIYIMRRRWLSSLQILNFASLNCFRGGLFTFRYKKVLLWRIIQAFDQDLVCCPFKL